MDRAESGDRARDGAKGKGERERRGGRGGRGRSLQNKPWSCGQSRKLETRWDNSEQVRMLWIRREVVKLAWRCVSNYDNAEDTPEWCRWDSGSYRGFHKIIS